MDITTTYMTNNAALGWVYSTRKEAEVKYKELKAEGFASLSKVTKIIHVEIKEIK
jgi:hypothetical protein